MPDDEEVQEDIDDERMENLSKPRSRGDFDDEDEENSMEYDGEDLDIEEEFVRAKPLKCRSISCVGMTGDRRRGFGDA